MIRWFYVRRKLALVPPVRVGGPEGSTLPVSVPISRERNAADGYRPPRLSETRGGGTGALDGVEAVARRGRRIHPDRVDGRRDDPRDPDRDGPADVPRREGALPGSGRPDRPSERGPRRADPVHGQRHVHDREQSGARDSSPSCRTCATWPDGATPSVATGTRCACASGAGRGSISVGFDATQFAAARMSASQSCFVILDATTGTKYGETTRPRNCYARLGAPPVT